MDSEGRYIAQVKKIQKCIKLAISDFGKISAYFHFIDDDLPLFTLTYLLGVGGALNVFFFWCANQNLKVQNSTLSEDSDINLGSLESLFIWL